MLSDIKTFTDFATLLDINAAFFFVPQFISHGVIY